MGSEKTTEQVAVRLERGMLERIEAYAARLQAASPGRLRVTRVDALRALLADALERAEAAAK
jgi:hypothetical protein